MCGSTDNRAGCIIIYLCTVLKNGVECMKKFIRRVVIIVIFLLITGTGIILSSASAQYRNSWSVITNSDTYDDSPTKEIVPYIQKAQQKNNGYTKLIIGDSVCHQIFNGFQNENEEYATIGSNQAITIVGQYILAHEFIQSHSDTTDVYLILTSLTGSGFSNAGYCYQYFVIPFTKANIIGIIDPITKKGLSNIFGVFYTNRYFIELIDRSNICRKLFLNSLSDNGYADVAQSYLYLKKIADLCNENGIELHLLHAPMEESAKSAVESEWSREMEVCQDRELLPYLKEYYNSVDYYPDNFFRDGIHFKDEYSSKEQLRYYVYNMQKNNQIKGFCVK